MKSFFAMLLVGGIFMMEGALIVLVSVDVIEVSDTNFNAPRSIVAFTGNFFIIAGILQILQGMEDFGGSQTPCLHFANQLVIFSFLFLLAILLTGSL